MNGRKFLMICDFFDEEMGYHESVIAKALIERNYEVIIVTSQYKNHFEHLSGANIQQVPFFLEGSHKLKVYRLPYRFKKLFLKSFKKKDLKRIMKTHMPDYVYVHGVGLDSLAVADFARSGKFEKFKYYIDFHGDRINSAKSWISLNIQHRIINKLILKRSLPYLERVFSVSQTSYDFVVENFDISPDLVEVLPLVPEFNRLFDCLSKSKHETCEKYGISKEKRLIFWGGKITREKLLHFLLKSLSYLDSYQLVLVGSCRDEEYKKEIDELLSSLGEKVICLGWLSQNEVFEIQSITDLAVFPTSQSVLWQQSLVLGNELICGDRQLSRDESKYVTIDLSYLGFNDKIIQFNPYESGILSLKEILERRLEEPFSYKPLDSEIIDLRLQGSMLSETSLINKLV